MAQEIQNFIHGMATLDDSAVVSREYNNHANAGTGNNTIDYIQPVDANECVHILTPSDNGAGNEAVATLVPVDDNTVRTRASADDGMGGLSATDINLHLVTFAAPVQG